jgi:RNA polymerase sigma-70 factor (ECF subfamily)
LRDLQDRQAWGEFVDIYAPLIYDYLRRRGLQDADAADLTQACLRRLAARMGSFAYDPQQGTFRGWLFTIVRNQLHDFRNPSRQRVQGSGDPQVQQLLEAQLSPETDEAEAWEREYRRGLLAWAAEQVRPQVRAATWQAFWQTAVEGRSGQEVARGLGMTAAAVYLARGRVMGRLRAVIRAVQEEE